MEKQNATSQLISGVEYTSKYNLDLKHENKSSSLPLINNQGFECNDLDQWNVILTLKHV